MKRLLALFCLFSLFTAFTCENEPLDDGVTPLDDVFVNNNLLGVWNLVDFDVEVNTTASIDGIDFSTDVQVFSTSADYTLDFTENTFTTNGGYSYSALVVANGMEIPNDPITLTNVSGNGTYTVDANNMTVNGQFFEFTLDGVDTSVFPDEQTVQFQISADGQTLMFTQNETQVNNDQATGLESTSVISSTSLWTRTVVDDTCDLEEATESAAEAFNNDNTNGDLCEAYRQALLAQIDSCGDDGSLQAILDDLGDCSVATSSGELRVTAGSLAIDFVDQTTSLEDGTIIVEGASELGNYTIYFEVTEGELGTDVIENFVLTLSGTNFFPSTQGFEDFTSETTASTDNILQVTFFGTVVNDDNGQLSLTQGVADLTY